MTDRRRSIQPGPGQESVWDYPRPPRVEDSSKHIQVIFNGVVIADTRRARRILETSHPPIYYIPPEDVKMEYLTRTTRSSFCEWKGAASYYTKPPPGYESLANYIAFYPSMMDACYIDGEKVQPQPGDFYSGWITSDIVGPFKGSPGSFGW